LKLRDVLTLECSVRSHHRSDPGDVTLSIQKLPDLLTVKEAAQYARVAHRSIYALMERGELNYIKIGRLRRIPKTALAQIIDPNLKGGWKLGKRAP